MKKQYFFSEQFKELNHHMIEATINILGFNNSTIRTHLAKELDSHNDKYKKQDSLIGTPVFDVLFPWQGQDKQPNELTDLLHQEVIKKIYKPYKHQLDAWKLLSGTFEKPKSLVITSGTGSGKTECFMVPIINSLVQQYEQTCEQLEGVQALFLYPLNALINSQKERLDDTTKDFGKNIRFCLYNGMTPENYKAEHKTKPNQVLSREELRLSPPPILVTNATMLEYMLIRQKDQAIIQKSQGKLRWIVLDEAHSYIGSTASELSLLLKRVMIAFGVNAQDVHFIATSATIGEDEEAKRKLINFLADLSGTYSENIHIITAKRDVPTILNNQEEIDGKTQTLADIEQIDQGILISQNRYDKLTKHPFAIRIRNQFLNELDKTNPQGLDELLNHLNQFIKLMLDREKEQESIYKNLSTKEYLLKWLDVLSFTKPTPNEDTPAFLPLRAHFFQRTLTGLYACVNPNCSGKHPHISNLGNKTNGLDDWSFGYLYGNQHQTCQYCESPVYEVAFCQGCKTPHLIAMEDPKNKKSNLKLVHFSSIASDEFSLNELQDEEFDIHVEKEQLPQVDMSPIVIMPLSQTKQLQSKNDNLDISFDEMFLNKEGMVFGKAQENTVPVILNQEKNQYFSTLSHCYFCELDAKKSNVLRFAQLGAPFYMSEAVPILLNYCEPLEKESDSLPYHGKRMISFTDSRQGTARITMKVRQDSERRTLRHIVYHALAQKQKETLTADEIREKQEYIGKLKSKINQLELMDGMQEIIESVQKDIDASIQELSKNMTAPIMSWQEMIENIEMASQFKYLKLSIARIAHVNDINSDSEIAELLLLNEFTRRPKNANSLETMGLVYFSYPQLEAISLKGDHLKHWQELGFEEKDWQDFLKLIIDFYIREYKFVRLTRNQINSMNDKFFGNFELVLSYENLNLSPRDQQYIRPWLQVNKQNPNRSQRLIKLIALNKGVDLSNHMIQDKINGLLTQAWSDLINVNLLVRGTRQDFSTYRFDFNKASLTIPTNVYICPVTNRLLDTTLKGITPYLPSNQSVLKLLDKKQDYQCLNISIPVFKPDNQEVKYTEPAKIWLKEQDIINKLRQNNQWTDVTDSVIAGMNIIITEEHSAQISSKLLEKYEDSFKDGKINLLNCSTTMEMGVDIGGISSVAMNNVPPHPANYLQRTGRAGRRNESQALAFTICKNNPHEQMVFQNTRWAFDTKIKPPYIKLNSRKIIQRHINAYLLGVFLNQISNHTETNILLKSGWFFLDWSDKDINKNYLKKKLEGINLEGSKAEELFPNTPYIAMQTWLSELKLQDLKDSSIIKDIESILKKSEFSTINANIFIEESLTALKSLQQFVIDKTLIKLKEFQEINANKHKLETYLEKLSFDIKSIIGGFLLADLARFGYLPRYGFPSGIVEFDIYNTSLTKNQSNSYHNEVRDEIQNIIGGKPTRDLAIALREYAPGNEVAVNGLIYQSAGLELNQYLNSSNSNDAQLLRYFGQCKTCGAIDYDVNMNHRVCVSCGSSFDTTLKFIEPMGFKVDYVAKPHTKIEHPTYVPVIEPKIQANTEVLNLPNPLIGDYRIDNDGKIFHQSRGIYGHGYFVCLHCGRAESSLYEEGSEDTKEAFEKQKEQFAKNHYPLKPVKELKELTENNLDRARGICHEIGHSIQHMHLGATDTTNVFELYLKEPNTQKYYHNSDENKVLLLTLAVIFKNALAECHGINADELGCGIKPLRMKKQEICAIYIYDKASGGAGFASIANQYIFEMFKKAKHLLQCPSQCDSACNNCLIDYDTRFIADKLDRNLALDYLSQIENYIALPQHAQILPQAEYSVQSLSQTVAENLNREFDCITLYLQGDTKSWSLSTAIREKILLWQQLDKKIEIVIPKSALNTMEQIDKNYLISLPKVFNQVSLNTWEDDNDDYLRHQILAQLSQINGKNILTLASTDKQVAVPNENFWQVNETTIIVQSKVMPKLETMPLDIEQVPQNANNNALQLEIKNELNSTVNKFGENFWKYIQAQHDELEAYIQNHDIVALEYSDAYVRSPLVLLLLNEVLYYLKQKNQSYPQLVIKTVETNQEYENPRFIYNNWDDSELQKDIIYQYMRDSGFDSNIDILKIYKISALSHHRHLTITWDNHRKTIIYFDHGFGFLKCNGEDISYPFKSSIDEQIQQLERFSKSSSQIYADTNKTTLITIKMVD